MIPITSLGRMEMPGGAWTNKMGGEFVEGDTSTKFFFEGRADIKELGGHLRVFFKDISLVKRPFIVSENQMNQFRERYREDRKKRRAEAYGADNADDSSDDEEEVKLERENRAINRMINEEKDQPLVIPKLTLFLTTKKPKSRMVDAHKTGCKIFLGTGTEEVFGEEDKVKSYEAPLRDILEVMGFQGLVVLKLPQDAPITEDPIVYSFIKLQSYRTMKKRTIDALHLSEITEELSRILAEAEEKNAKNPTTSPTKPKKKDKNAPPEPEIIPKKRKATDNIKALSTYRKLASKTWLHFEKVETEEVDFFMFMKMLNFLNIFLIQVQAIRIFNSVDIQGDRMMGISEFENALMALDLLGSSGNQLVVLDVFDSLKALPLHAQLKESYAHTTDNENTTKTSDEKAENRVKSPNSTNRPQTTDPASIKPGTAPKPTTANGGQKPGTASKTAKAVIEVPKARKKTDEELMIEMLGSCNNPSMGLDYSAFVEAVQMLGVPDTTEAELLREAFCYGAGIKIKDIDNKYLNLTEFRKAWLKVADLDSEMKKRGMKFEHGVFAQGRNRDRLSRFISDAETAYLLNLSKVNETVEGVKSERRKKKDQKRTEMEAHRAKLLHEANKFIAVRGQEKRLLIKKEQEEKSKKRTEDKVLRNKLLLRQQEALIKKREEISAQNKIKEKLRIDQIKALGLDKIIKSVLGMRHIDPELFTTPEAQTKLQYALLVDFSHNVIDALPVGTFLYWMTEARKLKLSENRLRTLPDDLQQMGSLEILELDTNRLDMLPDGLCALTNLQRLDISNNQLTALPTQLGNCAALRYFCAHSNHLSFIPTTLGNCFKLEYIDVSRNILVELPEDMRYMAGLTHLDCNSNRLSILPHMLGECTKLQYLDFSTNQINAIPNSFSTLAVLEYANFENNNIMSSENCFNSCKLLKYLNLRKNRCQVIYPDIGQANGINFLDFSVNNIMSLPIEIGLLTVMQELILTRNALVTLPPELGSCVNLQKLDIPYNQLIGTLPETIGLIHSLKYLDISFNSVDGLPRSIIGLKHLVELRMERCLLFELPDTITYLDKLELIDISNNKFRRFPIELQHMKALKTLNLANNAIELVQRNINTMTILDNLDLSRNRLLALPVEFTDILESVHTVTLHSNPWSLLPPRWGKLWPGTHATIGPQGYSLSDAVDFLYGMRTFYDTAEEIWLELGVYHYAGRLGFDDFLAELRLRIPKSWHEGLVEYVKYVYFKSRETGVFTRWYSLDEQLESENRALIAADSARRDKNVQRSRDELAMKQAMGEMIYSGDMNRKMHQVHQMTTEHIKNKELIDHIHSTSLFDAVKKKEKISEKRTDRREKRFARLGETEMTRLKDILDCDKEGREQEKLNRKRNRQLLLPLKSSKSSSIV